MDPTTDSAAFYDDSSKALGLGYSATRIASARPTDPSVAPTLTAEERQERIEAQERYERITEADAKAERDVLRKAGITDISKVVPTNAGAHRSIERRSRELESQGFRAGEASSIAAKEPTSAEPEQQPERHDYLGASVESLMHRKRGAGAGSSSGRALKKPKKKIRPDPCGNCNGRNADDVVVCQACGWVLPAAEGKPRRGRPSTGKTKRIRAKVTPLAKQGFKGRNVSEEMDILGTALALGKTYEQVRLERAALQGCDSVA